MPPRPARAPGGGEPAQGTAGWSGSTGRRSPGPRPRLAAPGLALAVAQQRPISARFPRWRPRSDGCSVAGASKRSDNRFTGAQSSCLLHPAGGTPAPAEHSFGINRLWPVCGGRLKGPACCVAARSTITIKTCAAGPNRNNPNNRNRNNGFRVVFPLFRPSSPVPPELPAGYCLAGRGEKWLSLFPGRQGHSLDSVPSNLAAGITPVILAL